MARKHAIIDAGMHSFVWYENANDILTARANNSSNNFVLAMLKFELIERIHHGINRFDNKTKKIIKIVASLQHIASSFGFIFSDRSITEWSIELWFFFIMIFFPFFRQETKIELRYWKRNTHKQTHSN